MDGRPGAAAALWQPLVNGAFEVLAAPGNHYSLLREPNVASLARRIGALLDRHQPVRWKGDVTK